MKRAVDFTCALLGLVVLSPLLLLIAAAVKLTSPGPAIFRQERIGRGRTRFHMYKFRTMSADTPHDVPTHLLEAAESHVTPLGRLLRRTSLDELPQMVNILTGDMSIVGPRPALWNQEDLILEREKYGANDVRPGLTGWAQVNGRDGLTVAEKAALDGYYVQHMGWRLDLRCLFASVVVVAKADGVLEGGVRATDVAADGEPQTLDLHDTATADKAGQT
jgi:O-antigen biosynthesis protein WbqP